MNHNHTLKSIDSHLLIQIVHHLHLYKPLEASIVSLGAAFELRFPGDIFYKSKFSIKYDREKRNEYDGQIVQTRTSFVKSFGSIAQGKAAKFFDLLPIY